MKRLTDMDRGVGRFYDSIAPLVESPKLGPVLWQLPDRFARDDERLAHALDEPPAGPPRVRAAPPVAGSPSRCTTLLREYGAAFVLHDDKRRPPDARGPDRRFHLPALPLRPPRAARQLLRHRAPRSGPSRVRALAREAEVFAYFNNDWEVFAPRNAKRLRALVN